MRLATPEGDLAHGVLSAAGLPHLPGVDDTGETQALVVLTGADIGPARARLTRSTRDSRAERRRQAASYGIRVDEATWRVVTEHAQRFLVPEEDS